MKTEVIIDNLTEIVSKREDKVKNGYKPVIYLNKDNIKAIEFVKNRFTPAEPVGCVVEQFSLVGWCPNCHSHVSDADNFCAFCSQSLDWRELIRNYLNY